MTVTQLLSPAPSGGGPTQLLGRIERADALVGIHGWATDVSTPGRALVVELCAGAVVVATAQADAVREDIRRLGFVRCEVGFRFDPGDLRSKMIGRGVPRDACLRVRVAGTDVSLPSCAPLPSAAEFMDSVGQDESHAEETLSAAAVARNPTAALHRMASQAADPSRTRPAPDPGKVAGFVEGLAPAEEDGLLWVLGWMGADLPLQASVLVAAASGAEHPSALVAAPHDGRTDLPGNAHGIVALLKTDWRPGHGAGGGGGGAKVVFLDGAAAGAHIRLLDRPKLFAANEWAAWVKAHKDALNGPFADSLKRMLAPLAASAAPPDRGAPQGFIGLMERGGALRAAGDHGAALDLFRAALALKPGDAWARLSVADALRDLRRFEEAEEACRALLADEPGNAGALMSLGHALRGRGDAAGALAHFQAVLETKPGHAWARLSAADALADLDRLDEAEEHCRALLADEPENAGALMFLGRVAIARADHRAGADWFERAVRAAPASAHARLGLADALRDLGEHEAAAEAAKAVLARKPDLADGWMSLGHTERRAGRSEAALEAFGRASGLKPGSPGPLIQMALEERRLGRPEASGRLLERALEADGGDVEALVQYGEHLRLSGAPDRALSFFRRAIEAPRPTPWAYLAASRVLADLGELDAALRTLDEAEGRLGAKPDIAAARAELLRRTGDWAGARAAVEAAAAAWPRHFGVWIERAHLERVSGRHDGFAACLREAPAGSTHERARVHALQGLLAAERWRLDEAQEHYARAIELNPDDGATRACLTQAQLLALDTEGAREQSRAAARLDQSAARMRGRTANASQTHLGHLLDEFVLDRRALAELQALRELAPEERVGPLLALVRHCPEYTPAAIGLLVALRQSGRLAAPLRRPPAPAAADASPIPRAVAQHWGDAEVPADLGRVMGSWGRLYPGFALRRFSDEQARAYLARFHPPEVQAAHRRSQDPAQRADIFRLAHLWSEGGYHTDSENRLVGDFGELRFPGARLVLYQEAFGTIGTAFIGAVPGHPLVGRALRLAVEAVNRGDSDMQWLSTGPGLLTRAFADLLADPGREPLAALDHTVVLEQGELQRAVAVHCLVGRGTVER